MGSDNFVASVQQQRGHTDRPTYQLDLSNYHNKEHLFEAVRQSLDINFEQFGEAVSNVGQAYLLLDNIPIVAGRPDGQMAVEQDLEKILAPLLEYCPQLNLIMRARRLPLYGALPAVELKPLDEPDVRTYLLESAHQGVALGDTEVVSTLYRHTDGIPIRIDNSLKLLQVVALSDLANSDSDPSIAVPTPADASPALVRAIQEIERPTEHHLRRSFDLLKTLTLFPQGEQLSRIKRFNGANAFYPAHARELLDHGLIDASSVQDVHVGGGEVPAKRLAVPRPVRDFVREKIDKAQFTKLNRKAADLYFGTDWRSGTLKQSASLRFDNPHRSSADITNAHTIIVRLLRDALSTSQNQNIGAVVRWLQLLPRR